MEEFVIKKKMKKIISIVRYKAYLLNLFLTAQVIAGLFKHTKPILMISEHLLLF